MADAGVWSTSELGVANEFDTPITRCRDNGSLGIIVDARNTVVSVSSVANSGLQVGDVIVAVDDKVLLPTEKLRERLGQQPVPSLPEKTVFRVRRQVFMGDWTRDPIAMPLSGL